MKNHPIAGGLAFIVLVGGLGVGVFSATQSAVRQAKSPEASKAQGPRFSDLGEAIDFGIALARRERMKEALSHFEELTRLYPEAAAAWHNYGLALSAVRMYEPARSALERALQLEPDSWDTTAELATLHVLEKDPTGGIELLKTIPPGEGRVGKRLRLDPVWTELEDPRIDELLQAHPAMEDTSLRKSIDEARAKPPSEP